MKAAICFYGLVGSRQHKGGKGEVLPPEIAHESYARHIFAHQDCDVFIHTWSVDQEDQLAVSQDAYRLLGLWPAEVDILDVLLEAMEEQAGGFYDPRQRSFYLLDDMPAAAAGMLIAHELTHALEDQYFDLDGRLRESLGDDDRALALSAVHEGSATLLMTIYSLEESARGHADPAGMDGLGQSGAGQGKVLADLRPRRSFGRRSGPANSPTRNSRGTWRG